MAGSRPTFATRGTANIRANVVSWYANQETRIVKGKTEDYLCINLVRVIFLLKTLDYYRCVEVVEESKNSTKTDVP